RAVLGAAALQDLHHGPRRQRGHELGGRAQVAVVDERVDTPGRLRRAGRGDGLHIGVEIVDSGTVGGTAVWFWHINPPLRGRRTRSGDRAGPRSGTWREPA